jgi:hypothetical protein
MDDDDLIVSTSSEYDKKQYAAHCSLLGTMLKMLFDKKINETALGHFAYLNSVKIRDLLESDDWLLGDPGIETFGRQIAQDAADVLKD